MLNLLLRRIVYALVIGPLAIVLVAFGAVVIFPAMIFMGWLHGDDRPIAGARWVLTEGPGQDMLANWPRSPALVVPHVEGEGE